METFTALMGNSGEEVPIRFFRWFWDFLKEQNSLS